MSQSETGKCLNHPKFKQLTHARARFNLIFSLIITVSYGLYVLGMSYVPGFMAHPLREGGNVTYGILIAILVILIGMVSAGIYTWWANRRFDALKSELLKDPGYA